MERSMISSHSVMLQLVAALLVATQYFMVVNAGELHRGGPGGRFQVESDVDAATARRLLNSNSCGGGRAPTFGCASILWQPVQPRCCRTGSIRRCKDVYKDRSNCGACNSRCRSPLSCCAGRCVNQNLDRNNCGRCFNRCPNNLSCLSGQCGY